MTSKQMSHETAKRLLAELLQFGKTYWQDDGDECAKCAVALLEWFNRSTVTKRDLSLLKRIAIAGFKFWQCPSCGDLVCEGEDAVDAIDPDWGSFQGVNENDRCSYPGDGYRDMRCNHCRCFNVGQSRLPDHCEC